MGAHSRSGATASTGARFATTTLAIAATSVLGAGTALAHDDSGQYGDSHSSTGWDRGGYQGDPGADGSTGDVLTEVGMSSWDPTWDTNWDSGWDSSSDDEGPGDDHDEGSGEDTGDGPVQPAAQQPAAQQAVAPAPARPTTSTQPIAAPASTVPAELPAPGETQTIPIRGTR